MSWTQRGQQRLIDYLVAENRILRKKLGKKRVPLTDVDRAILGRAGKAIGRKLLEKYATIATPDTILRWHRKLIALKWTFKGSDDTAASRPVGRPRTPDEIEQLVVQLAKENPGWGYDRIVGALASVGHEIGATTVGEILARNGIPPAPRRRSTWAQFIKAHHAVLAGADFFTTEVWTKLGLTTVYTLFAIRLATRRVEILGTTTNPNADFMAQVARDLAIERSPLFDGVTHLIIDRDTKYTVRFEELMRDSGIELVKIPGCPQANSVSERFVKSVKTESLRKLIFFGIGSLERALREYIEFHYRHERNHQGIGILTSSRVRTSALPSVALSVSIGSADCFGITGASRPEIATEVIIEDAGQKPWRGDSTPRGRGAPVRRSDCAPSRPPPTADVPGHRSNFANFVRDLAIECDVGLMDSASAEFPDHTGRRPVNFQTARGFKIHGIATARSDRK